MRFSTKMFLAITILLAVFVSATGTILVRQNFQDSLQATSEQNISKHLLERYSLEAELLRLLSAGEAASGENLVRYGAQLNDYFGDSPGQLAFYDEEKQQIYTSFSSDVPEEAQRAVLDGAEGSYVLQQHGGRTYMLMASHLNSPARELWLLSGYDVSGVFTQRDAQLRNLWRVGGVVLVVGAVLVVALSRLLTRPIRRLNRVSREMARGAYDQRVGACGNDEIGELAQNFDVMAESVQQHVQQLSESVQQRDDFVSAFSHEMKTPMTSIIGFSDFVRSMEVDPQTRQTAANHIYHEAKRLEALSQKLLGLMGLSDMEMAPEAVKLSSIFAATKRSLLPIPEGMQLEFTACQGEVMLVDKDLVVDLLRNLILNAMKAGPRDGMVKILIGERRQGEAGPRLELAVADTGCGIPAEELGRITEPFYMVDKSRSREAGGSGIGLALCQKIMLLHGGGLRFQSTVGKGTVVSFSLPLQPTEAAEAGEMAAQPKPAEAEEAANAPAAPAGETVQGQESPAQSGETEAKA